MTDEYYMMMALKEAKKAYEDGEIPVTIRKRKNRKIELTHIKV
jgi:tRNA(Arg) A34 adenosine deaminase TadA